MQSPVVVAGPRRMWHVTVTVAGPAVSAREVFESLGRLADKHQFLSARYSAGRAEVRYWDESVDARGAAARGLMLWSEYAELAALPAWDVVGLEVVDHETLVLSGSAPNPIGSGQIRPFVH
jgi:hypothetical protein